jgi:hypothetical protein
LLQVREKEADIDSMIAPIEDMYSLLLRYEVSSVKTRSSIMTLAYCKHLSCSTC